MMGTPANKPDPEPMRVILASRGRGGRRQAISWSAIRASCADASAGRAMARPRRAFLDAAEAGKAGGEESAWQAAKTLRGALARPGPDASLALISVPGDFAVAEARKAINVAVST